MASDNWHHIEGTYPSAGIFRLYLYDDYTRPLPTSEAKKIRARVVIKEIFDPATKTSRELTAAPLVLARGGAYFEAHIEPLALPANMTAKVAFGNDTKENRFDFTFPAYSKDAPLSLSTKAAAAAPPEAQDRPAAALDNGPTAGLMKNLNERTDTVAELVRNGTYGAIYVPALQAKDLALEIQARQGSSPKKSAIDTHVKQIVVAAYQLDNYGDLGDSEKITTAYRDFAAAVSALNSLLAGRP